MTANRALTLSGSKITLRVVGDDRVPGNGQKQPVAYVCAVCGKTKNATNAKARRLLGWTPRSNEESIVTTAESLVRLGLVKGVKAAA